MKAKYWIIAVAIVTGVLALTGIVWALSSGVPVEAVEVTRGPIHQFVDERGMTRLPKTYLVTMPFTGRIEAIHVTEGERVFRPREVVSPNEPWTDHENFNQPVAQVVQEDLQLRYEQLNAVVERVEAQIAENADNSIEMTVFEQALDFVRSMEATVAAAESRTVSGRAKLDFASNVRTRAEEANRLNPGSVTADELDRARLDHVQSQVDFDQDKLVLSSLEALKSATDLTPWMVLQYIWKKDRSEAVLQREKAEALARLDQVKRDRELGIMYSPVDGVVLARHVSNERYLSAGTTLLEVGRLEDLEVEADVLSLDVVEAKQGDPVEIYGPAIGSEPVNGRVSNIYPSGFTKVSSLGVEQQRVKVIVQFKSEDLRRLLDEKGLGVGYRVRVRIRTAEKPDALRVPRSALFRGEGSKWQVYAVRGGKVRLQTVDVGLINDRMAEITSGLEKNDLVVRAPQSSLEDGQRVNAQTVKLQDTLPGETGAEP